VQHNGSTGPVPERFPHQFSLVSSH
jgi:hypothetical protein